MKVIENMQAKMEASDKKLKSLMVAFHNLNKETQMENDEQNPLP